MLVKADRTLSRVFTRDRQFSRVPCSRKDRAPVGLGNGNCMVMEPLGAVIMGECWWPQVISIPDTKCSNWIAIRPVWSRLCSAIHGNYVVQFVVTENARRSCRRTHACCTRWHVYVCMNGANTRGQQTMIGWLMGLCYTVCLNAWVCVKKMNTTSEL